MYEMRKLENVPNVEYDGEKKTILFAEDYQNLCKNIHLNTLANKNSLGFFGIHDNFLKSDLRGRAVYGTIRGSSKFAPLTATKISTTTFSPFPLNLKKSLFDAGVALPEFFNFIREMYSFFGDNFSPSVFEINFYKASEKFDYVTKTFKTELFGFYKTDTVNKLPNITPKSLKLITKNGDLTGGDLDGICYFQTVEEVYSGIAGYVESRGIYLTVEDMENPRAFFESILNIEFLADIQNVNNIQRENIIFSLDFQYTIAK